MIYLKFPEAVPYEKLKKKVTINFDKVKIEYKLKGYANSKANIANESISRFESIYVIDENLTAAVNCVSKRLITLRLKTDGYRLCGKTKLY